MNDTPTTNDQGETMPVGYSSAGGITFVNVYDPSTHKVVPKDAAVLDLDVQGSSRPINDWLRDAVALLRTPGQRVVARRLEQLADQIEAQTEAPRIEEPAPIGAIVTDGNGGRWARTARETSARWVSLDRLGHYSSWAALSEPIREGVQS